MLTFGNLVRAFVFGFSLSALVGCAGEPSEDEPTMETDVIADDVDPQFSGGVRVAVGDVNGDGASAFRGGVHVATGDVDGDGATAGKATAREVDVRR